MVAPINNESTTTEPRQRTATKATGGLNVFYWLHVLALDPTVAIT